VLPLPLGEGRGEGSITDLRSPHPNPLPRGEGTGQAFLPEALSPRTLSVLRSPAKILRRARQNFKRAGHDAAQAEQTAESHDAQLHEALTSRGETDLATAMDRAGGLVAQYRRRLQIDQRLDQLDRHRTDLEEQVQSYVVGQLLPGWILAAFGAVIVLGLTLGLAGFLLPQTPVGTIGFGLALLGFGTAVAAVGVKYLLEKTHARQLESLQKQLVLLTSQTEQSQEERAALDRQLPPGGESLAGRLEAAERDLAALEELMPLETRRSAARQEADDAGRRRDELRREYQTAVGQWRRKLTDLGLPPELKVKQLKMLVRHQPAVVAMQRRLAERRAEARRRREEWEHVTGRLSQVAADARVTLSGDEPGEHLRQLAAALAEHQAVTDRHEAIRLRLRAVRRRTLKHAEALSRIKHRRRKLFFEAGVREEEEFRGRAVQYGRAEVLRRQRAELETDIVAALGAEFSAEAVGQLLDGTQAADFDAREKSWRNRLADLETQVRGRLENRGQISAQLQTLIDDRQLPQTQLELGVLDRRIEETTRRWHVLAAVNLALDRLRGLYERERQPETLQEASRHLERMTRGRYGRVWTPLDEPTLRVDGAGGESLPVERLSRGTREQLFLCLRLALAAGYARRGAALPMVLDDVLVNFDADRAAAAAEVLRDFAAAGRQLLVFTCHEHIESLFARLGVPRSRLPSPADGGAVLRFTLPAAAEPPPKSRPAAPRKSPARVKVVEHAEEPPPPPKPAPKSPGAFDADFFDARPDKEEDAEEPEDELTDHQEFPGTENAEAA
ncbi:MAG: hypothetical protein JXB10_05475, partial [Pirellulales bacterium]|nr:hypothetical protein [Pirellulales bacterium]